MIMEASLLNELFIISFFTSQIIIDKCLSSDYSYLLLLKVDCKVSPIFWFQPSNVRFCFSSLFYIVVL